jgi:hypothetical protein
MKMTNQAVRSFARFYFFGSVLLVGVAYGLLIKEPVAQNIKLLAGTLFAALMFAIDVVIIYVGAQAFVQSRIAKILAEAVASNEPFSSKIAQLEESTIASLSKQAVPAHEAEPFVSVVASLLRSQTVVLASGSPYVGVVVVKYLLSAAVALAFVYGI